MSKRKYIGDGEEIKPKRAKRLDVISSVVSVVSSFFNPVDCLASVTVSKRWNVSIKKQILFLATLVIPRELSGTIQSATIVDFRRPGYLGKLMYKYKSSAIFDRELLLVLHKSLIPMIIEHTTTPQPNTDFTMNGFDLKTVHTQQVCETVVYYKTKRYAVSKDKRFILVGIASHGLVMRHFNQSTRSGTTWNRCKVYCNKHHITRERFDTAYAQLTDDV